jgi:hypothetical protein
MDAVSKSFVAECFWPDVHEHDVRELDERIRVRTAERDDVRFLGSVLIRADEVVLFHFEGTDAGVRELAEQAGVPFERLLETDVAFSATTNAKGESDA